MDYGFIEMISLIKEYMTIIFEKILEDISFDADEKKGEKVTVTKELVGEKLDDIVENEDITRYIL